MKTWEVVMIRILMGFVALLIIFSQSARAGNVAELEDGTHVLEEELPSPVKQRLDVVITNTAKAYPDAWRQALRTGEPVPVKTTVGYEFADGIEGLWVLHMTAHATKSVVYDREQEVVDVVDKTTVTDYERIFHPIAIIVAIGFIAMFLSLLLGQPAIYVLIAVVLAVIGFSFSASISS